MLRKVPMFMTLGNLLLGLGAVALAYYSFWLQAGILMILAAIFDGLDGFVARRLKVESERGANADAIADLFSFAVAPSAMLILSSRSIWTILAASIFALAVFGRLVRFRLNPPPKGIFFGLPSPVAAMPVVAMTVMTRQGIFSFPYMEATAIFCALMAISLIPYPAWRHPSMKFLPGHGMKILISFQTLMLVLFPMPGLLGNIIFYMIIGPPLLLVYRKQYGTYSRVEVV